MLLLSVKSSDELKLRAIEGSVDVLDIRKAWRIDQLEIANTA